MQSVSGLPTGLRYDAASNSIVGAAGQLGRFTVTETVADQHGATASQSFVLDVRAATVLFTSGNDTRDLNTVNVDAYGNSATRALGGNDVVTLSDTGQKGVIFYADDGNDRVIGSLNNDRIHGNTGTDILNGGIGNDVLWGDGGKDTLTGGTGGDRFTYKYTTDSAPRSTARDVISDFRQADGDLLNLHIIDAVKGVSGNQDFTFIGEAAFTGLGQIRFFRPDAYSTIVEANTGAGTAPELQIELAGNLTLSSGDFLL